MHPRMMISAFVFTTLTASTMLVSPPATAQQTLGPAAGPAQGGTMAPPSKTAKPKGPAKPVVAPIGMIKALTEAECTGLGGKVVTVGGDNCGSFKKCLTTDSNGVIRQACIDK